MKTKKKKLTIDEWLNLQGEIIRICKEKHPDEFLRIDLIYVGPIGKLIPIGLFKCMRCAKPINHNQFNFGRACGRCDVGKISAMWIIEKPTEAAIRDAEIRSDKQEERYKRLRNGKEKD